MLVNKLFYVFLDPPSLSKWVNWLLLVPDCLSKRCMNIREMFEQDLVLQQLSNQHTQCDILVEYKKQIKDYNNTNNVDQA